MITQSSSTNPQSTGKRIHLTSYTLASLGNLYLTQQETLLTRAEIQFINIMSYDLTHLGILLKWLSYILLNRGRSYSTGHDVSYSAVDLTQLVMLYLTQQGILLNWSSYILLNKGILLTKAEIEFMNLKSYNLTQLAILYLTQLVILYLTQQGRILLTREGTQFMNLKSYNLTQQAILHLTHEGGHVVHQSYVLLSVWTPVLSEPLPVG